MDIGYLQVIILKSVLETVFDARRDLKPTSRLYYCVQTRPIRLTLYLILKLVEPKFIHHHQFSVNLLLQDAVQTKGKQTSYFQSKHLD